MISVRRLKVRSQLYLLYIKRDQVVGCVGSILLIIWPWTLSQSRIGIILVLFGHDFLASFTLLQYYGQDKEQKSTVFMHFIIKEKKKKRLSTKLPDLTSSRGWPKIFFFAYLESLLFVFSTRDWLELWRLKAASSIYPIHGQSQTLSISPVKRFDALIGY